MSHLYSHILTSCFLDTILIPLCTWLYLLAIVALFVIFSRRGRTPHSQLSNFYMVHGFRSHKKTTDIDINEESAGGIPHRRHGKIYLVVSVLYYLLLVAQLLMCVLELVRLSLAHLGIGLLPFTFVSIIVAGALRLTKGLQGRVRGWRWANLALWVALAIMNGVKIAEEVKEGTGMRKGTKYPVVDELTDVSVMIGVYTVLGILEVCLRP
jgi:hypothetical protein